MGGECKKLEECKDLEGLFKMWQVSWENSEYKPVYTYKNKPKCCFEHESYKGREEWFFPDGFLGDKELCEILFISKESHEEGKPQNDNYMDFYMKKVVNKIEGNKGNDGGIRYPRHMAAVKDAISKENKGKKWSDFEKNNCFETLKDCGYMNLNKHGGKAKTPLKPFEGLVKADKEYIKQQIKIMKPKKIVLLGADLYDLFSNEGFFEGYIKGKTLFKTDHPNARTSYKNYINKLYI